MKRSVEVKQRERFEDDGAGAGAGAGGASSESMAGVGQGWREDRLRQAHRPVRLPEARPLPRRPRSPSHLPRATRLPPPRRLLCSPVRIEFLSV